MYKLTMPKEISLNAVTEFIKKLDASEDMNEVGLDMNSIEFVTPTSMLLCGGKIRRWRLTRQEKGLVTKLGKPAHSDALMYMRHMGFFDYIQTKTDHGKKMGKARGSASYVPIRQLDRPEFTDRKSWYESIVSSIRPLANVLAGSFLDSEEHRFYIYTLREIVRNVFEHSESESCFICGQRWADGRVEISLLDEGIGLLNSLSKSHAIDNDNIAIKMAIEPGISSTNKLNDQDNKYDNSGYGLFVLSEVVSAFGEFTIGSNTRRITIKGKQSSTVETNFRGTYVGIKINKAPKDFTQLLSDVIEYGEAEAKNSISASSASKTLSLDQI